jgi:hypothetical protein
MEFTDVSRSWTEADEVFRFLRDRLNRTHHWRFGPRRQPMELRNLRKLTDSHVSWEGVHFLDIGCGVHHPLGELPDHRAQQVRARRCQGLLELRAGNRHNVTCGHFALLRCSETTSKDREVAASHHGDTPYSGNSVTSVLVTPYTTSVDVNVDIVADCRRASRRVSPYWLPIWLPGLCLPSLIFE